MQTLAKAPQIRVQDCVTINQAESRQKILQYAMAHTFCAQHLHFVICRLEYCVGIMIVIPLATQASETNKPAPAGPARPSKAICAVWHWFR